MSGDNKSVHVSFRISEKEYSKFEQCRTALGLEKSEFFRLLTLHNMNNPAPQKTKNSDYKRCLYYLSATSNNMNQIAYKLNLAHQQGIVSHEHYLGVLSLLSDIKNFLSSSIESQK